MRVRVACAVFVALLSAWALQGVGAASGRDGTRLLPKVSLREARKVVEQAGTLEDRAGKANDASGLAEFATGLVLEIETALIAVAAAENEPAWDSSERTVEDVFTVPTTSYPRSFVALIEEEFKGGTVDKSAAVFTRASKSAPWLLDRWIAHPVSGWPKFAVDADGYLKTEVNAAKLLIDPATAPSELSTYLTVTAPGEAPNAALFAPSPGTDEYRNDTLDYLAGWGEGWAASQTGSPSSHQVLIFQLKDKSALVSFGLATTTRISHPDANPDEVLEQDAARTTWDARLAPGLYREVVENTLEDFTVIVPTTKSKKAATAIYVLTGPISVTGTPVADPSLYT